ncbi:MAG: hypothetical protein LUG98_01565 [Tannerellaceae bacterium]|nr:hypothetical protein [Tannerellaceae bacterium]
MGKYIKVSPFTAEQLGLAGIRQRSADGNYILWQQDLAGIEGETLEERCRYIGGVIIERNQGKVELKGTDEPVPIMEGSEEDLPENLPEEPNDYPAEDPAPNEEQDPITAENNTSELLQINKRRKSR